MSKGPHPVAPPAPSSGRPLKVGVIVPALSALTGSAVHWPALVEFAHMAEEVGFDSIWIPDHLYFQMGDGSDPGAWEGWTLLTALAAVTRRIEIGSFVTCTGFRNPALIAKMADTVDEISGGRLILGLGAGYLEAEYTAFGFPFDHRVSRFEEAIAIIHGLLRTGQIDFTGTYYQARECELRPRGPRSNGPPIMIGSTGKRMLRLVARYADVWNVFCDDDGTANRVDRVPPLRALVDAACTAEGRDPRTLARSAAVMMHTTTSESDISQNAEDVTVRGSPAELAAVLRDYAAEGISHVQVMLDPITPAAVAAFAPVLEILDR